MKYFFVLIAYLIGSIPFGLLFGKIAGVDVRQSGSGNIGATNVSRVIGKKMGLFTLLADVGKALLPMLLMGLWLRGNPDREFWVALCGAAAFLGHLYPVYLKFKGGKGVATALGIFLYIAPLAAVVDLAIFAFVVYNWGYVSLGSLTAALMMPGLAWLIYGSVNYALLAGFIGALIWFKHRDNIRRLLRNEEESWRKK